MVSRRLCVGSLIVTFLLPSPALAQTTDPAASTPPTTGVCAISRGAICTGLGQEGAASPPPADATNDAVTRVATHRQLPARQPSPFLWERVFLPVIDGCIDGHLYVDRLRLRATGEVLRTTPNKCLPNPTPTGGTPPAVSNEPERPPAERVWSEVPLPEPTWGLNPATNGLTGLSTRLWDPSGGAQVTAAVDLGGFTATAVATPMRYEWKMWDGADIANRNPDPVVSSKVPGSEANPAATYTYESTGDFTVRQTVTWKGTYTFVGPGVNEVVDLGSTTTTSVRVYHVIEVRGTRR